ISNKYPQRVTVWVALGGVFHVVEDFILPPALVLCSDTQSEAQCHYWREDDILPYKQGALLVRKTTAIE
ncbi:MAG: hypothetical protein J6R46_03685, partial [Clostridia bacterium]|nr:hypothetical protein [Clostridia bacterium]